MIVGSFYSVDGEEERGIVLVVVGNICLMSVEVRGPFEGVFSLLLPCGFWGSNSGPLWHLTVSLAGLELAMWPRMTLNS